MPKKLKPITENIKSTIHNLQMMSVLAIAVCHTEDIQKTFVLVYTQTEDTHLLVT